MFSEACARKLEELRNNDSIKKGLPDVPLAFMLQDAVNLYEWCQHDREILSHANLDWDLVEDLPVRTEALQSIETVWHGEHLTTKDSQKVWKAALPEAIQLKKELLRHFFYAYKNRQDVYSKVQRIAEGNNYADMIQDLIDFYALGKKYPDELMAIHFDMNLLDKARDLSFSLGNLYASANNARRSGNENLLLRNKAFYHLKDAMNTIRIAGKYAFHHDKERHKGYIDAYVRKNNQLYRKKKSKLEK
jgi:hypothetical protein